VGCANLVLPPTVPGDPIFNLNIADCLSDLSHEYLLPFDSTSCDAGDRNFSSKLPRALFVGLDPKESLTLRSGRISFEEWRKKIISESLNHAY
jgi:hypothetical protein